MVNSLHFVFLVIIFLPDAFRSEPVHKVVPFTGCESNAYPPPDSDAVPSYVINLDLSPQLRWKHLIKEREQQLVDVIAYMKSLTIGVLGPTVFKLIIDRLSLLASTLPSPYYEEIEGIAATSGIPLSEITLYNIFYEVFTLCTSIIIQDPQGKLYHGRNLDFGLFMGWDSKNHTWILSELLKPLVVQVEWYKEGKKLYDSTNYVGYIGIVTAMKKDKFTLSIDERFRLNGGYVGILEWIIFKDYKQRWMSFLTRHVMETAETYKEAQIMLGQSRLLAPVYFILGGAQPWEGCIITRYRDANNMLSLGSSKSGQGSWLLVETNYDHWKSPPFYDDRRTPAIKCLNDGGINNVSLSLLYNVLSITPVLNKLTTYTTLMEVSSGYFKTWLRHCPDPCWPF